MTRVSGEAVAWVARVEHYDWRRTPISINFSSTNSKGVIIGHSHFCYCYCDCSHHGGEPLAAHRPSRDWIVASPDETVCYCQGVSKTAIMEASTAGAFTALILKAMTGAGRGKQCKQCHPLGRGCEADLDERVRLYAASHPLGASGSRQH